MHSKKCWISVCTPKLSNTNKNVKMPVLASFHISTVCYVLSESKHFEEHWMWALYWKCAFGHKVTVNQKIKEKEKITHCSTSNNFSFNKNLCIFYSAVYFIFDYFIQYLWYFNLKKIKAVCICIFVLLYLFVLLLLICFFVLTVYVSSISMRTFYLY